MNALLRCAPLIAALSACVGTSVDVPKVHPANASATSIALPASSSLLASASRPQKPQPDEPMPANHQHQHGSAAPAASVGPHGDQATPASSAEPAPAASYTCPMHPQIVRNAPGKCPICGMNLVKKEPHAHGGAQ